MAVLGACQPAQQWKGQTEPAQQQQQQQATSSVSCRLLLEQCGERSRAWCWHHNLYVQYHIPPLVGNCGWAAGQQHSRQPLGTSMQTLP